MIESTELLVFLTHHNDDDAVEFWGDTLARSRTNHQIDHEWHREGTWFEVALNPDITRLTFSSMKVQI